MKNKLVSLGTAIVVLAMTVGLPLSAPTASAKQGATTSINVVPTITSLSVVNGQLVAAGTATAIIKGQTVTAPFSGVPVDITLAQNQPAGATCPVLDLRLGPITLNLLGLVVQTSPICLEITATQGGGLLGDLLCSIGGLLNQGLSLNQALATLNATQLNTLLAGLTDLLNGALAQLVNAILTAINPVGAHRICSILHLELGPLNLTLLGLNVMLDNCANGPVTVDISAVTGRGNLLGNLLCGLLGGFNLGATLQNILNQLAALPRL